MRFLGYFFSMYICIFPVTPVTWLQIKLSKASERNRLGYTGYIPPQKLFWWRLRGEKLGLH